MDLLTARKNAVGGAVLALAVAAATLGWGGSSSAEASGSAPHARERGSSPSQALEAIRKAYQEENLEAFFAQVAADPYFNSTELKQRLTDRFAHASEIELIFHVDHELPENDRTLVKTRWQRRWTAGGTGSVETAEGKAHLIFSRSGPDGPWKLLGIREDDPF